MGKKKPGLTLERHQEVGAELREMYHRLQSLAVEFSHAYPMSDGAYQELNKAVKALGSVRSGAEDNLFREHRDRATTKVYYGGGQPDNQTTI